MNERDSRLWFSSVPARLEHRRLTQYVRRSCRRCPDGNAMHNPREAPVINRFSIWDSRPASDEEVRFHAQLSQRLFELHRERFGLWSRIRRFLLGIRLDR